jgi:hypothetical protein
MDTITGILNGFTDPNNPDQMAHLHRLINVFDAKKDAFHANITVNRGAHSKLYSAITSMVGTDMYNAFGSDRDLATLEEYVLPSLDKIKAGSASAFSGTLGDAPTPISMLKSNVQILAPIIPEEIEYAIVDAAANPKEYNSQILIVETPGQFSDPGTRPMPSGYYPGDATPIIVDLSIYGFAPNSTFTAHFNHGVNPITATIVIVLNGNTITVTIDRTGKYDSININGTNYAYQDIQAFDGNPTKNAFINGMDTSPSSILFALVYVLCKEIGDTIQVLILISLFTIGQLNSSNTLIFTPDIVFAMRCRLVYVPCLLKKMVANSAYRSLLHYTGAVNVVQQLIAINRCYKNQCKGQNTSIRSLIAGLIINRVFNVGGSDKPLTDAGIRYLTEIMDKIGDANNRIDVLDENEDKAVFRLRCSENIAFNLFGKSGLNNVHKPNMSIKKLFPPGGDPANNLDFGAGFAYKLIEENGQTGGSVKKKYKGGETFMEDDLSADFYDLCYPYLLFVGANYVDLFILKKLENYPSLGDFDRFFNSRLNTQTYETYYRTEMSSTIQIGDDNRNIVTTAVQRDIKKYIPKAIRKLFGIDVLTIAGQIIDFVTQSPSTAIQIIPSKSSRKNPRSSDNNGEGETDVEDVDEVDNDIKVVKNHQKVKSRPKAVFSFGGGSRKINKSNMITTRRNKNKYSIKLSKKNKRPPTKTQRRRRN